MTRLVRLLRTSIGRKLLVAATGTLLLGFLLVHMAGNLVILKGADALNAYADWMQGHPLLWVFRAGLLALFAVHVVTAVRLARDNRAAGSTPYRHGAMPRGRLLGRWMLVSGLLVLAFLAFHLLHLTLGAVGPAAGLTDPAGRADVYGRVVASFSDPLFAALYLTAMAVLALHLLHATESFVQTFGFNHESYQGAVRFIAPLLALCIAAGFAAVPFLVLTGVLPGGGS